MTETPQLSLHALRLSQNRRAQARDELEMAMVSYWIELSGVQPGERTRVGRRHLIQLLGAYAERIFEIGAGELFNLKLESIHLGECLDGLASEVQVQMIPPQFHINSGFCLTKLEYDEPYQSHIRAVIEDCARAWKEKQAPETEGVDHLSPRLIIARYCEREKCTIKQLAMKATVDESVIHAIKADRKKCSADALARIAGIIGCEPSDLAPKG